MVCVFPVPGGPCTRTTDAPAGLLAFATANTAARCGAFRRRSVFSSGSPPPPPPPPPIFLSTEIFPSRRRRDADTLPMESNAANSRSDVERLATRDTTTSAPCRESARNVASRRSRSSASFSGPPPFPVSHSTTDPGRSTRHTRTRSRVDAPPVAETKSRPPLEPPVSTPSTHPSACREETSIEVLEDPSAPTASRLSRRTRSFSWTASSATPARASETRT